MSVVVVVATSSDVSKLLRRTPNDTAVRRDEKQKDPETKNESRINLIGTLGMLDNMLKGNRNYSTRCVRIGLSWSHSFSEL